MFFVILYQKKDDLAEIMFKLAESKEKFKFRMKEAISFFVLILFCIAVIASRVRSNYLYDLDYSAKELKSLFDLEADIEIITVLSMSLILLVLLYQLYIHHKREF